MRAVKDWCVFRWKPEVINGECVCVSGGSSAITYSQHKGAEPTFRTGRRLALPIRGGEMLRHLRTPWQAWEEDLPTGQAKKALTYLFTHTQSLALALSLTHTSPNAKVLQDAYIVWSSTFTCAKYNFMHKDVKMNSAWVAEIWWYGRLDMQKLRPASTLDDDAWEFMYCITWLSDLAALITPCET